MTARFDSSPIVEFLDDGRTVRLVQPFGFFDDAGVAWPVPAGTVVDGASIPRPLWTLIGGPFEGRYRNASIIHDLYCDTQDRPWRAVHRVFYDAMIVSQVGIAQAKLMYYAVVRFGPRWSIGGVEAAAPPPAAYDAAEVARAAALIETGDPSPADLARLAESRPGTLRR